MEELLTQHGFIKGTLKNAFKKTGYAATLGENGICYLTCYTPNHNRFLWMKEFDQEGLEKELKINHL